MKNLFGKLSVCSFFLILSISTFGQEGLLDRYFSSTLDKCIRKNIDNILNFKIVPPQELHGLKISFTQELLSRLEKTLGENALEKFKSDVEQSLGVFNNSAKVIYENFKKIL